MTDPKIAIALHYAWGEGTPTITASGKGTIATRIVDEAVRHGVPVHADAVLASLLAKAPVGTAIPAEAFLAVAQLLAFLKHVDGLAAQQDGPNQAPEPSRRGTGE
jgi:flagellar biosynthesis protein